LLNALLNDDKAIVSDIAGTTRDAIEDEVTLEGIKFRFVDTAGIRETTDKLENIGIERSYKKAKEALIIIYLTHNQEVNDIYLSNKLSHILLPLGEEITPNVLTVINKADRYFKTETEAANHVKNKNNVLCISAAEGWNLSALTSHLLSYVDTGLISSNQTIVTNLRHLEALTHTQTALNDVTTGLNNGITGDFLAIDIRKALHHLGEITGTITTDDLLGNIFSRFCIGK